MQEKKRVIALGFFDGVHIGHGALLRRVTQVARRLEAQPAALTFASHPKTLISGNPVPLLNTGEEREWIMKTLYGVEEVITLPFDRATMELPWDRFVTEILVERFGAVHVVAGHDYHFGYRGQGDPQRLQELCARLGVGCDIIQRVELEGVTCSSTHVRSLVSAGDMAGAERFLGHPHYLSGTVVPGRRLGRILGFPTANLIPAEGILLPPFGVYATRVLVGEERCLAVTNVGVRPTVEERGQITVESWLPDFSGDLYGQRIRIEFHAFLRPEQSFGDLEQLKLAIRQDGERARSILEEKHI